MSAPFAFDLAAHPEADLLRTIARATELHDEFEIARRRGEKAYVRCIKAHCKEAVNPRRQDRQHAGADPGGNPGQARIRAAGRRSD